MACKISSYASFGAGLVFDIIATFEMGYLTLARAPGSNKKISAYGPNSVNYFAMIMNDFAHVDTWVFDLDNTLYPPHMRLFDQIEARMVNWITDLLGVTQAQANQMRRDYWLKHGTTMSGLMTEHGMEPEQFLIDVHDIDFSVLDTDFELRGLIESLPGRKIVYTNGTAPYAENVLSARGLSGLFNAIYGVEHAGYRPNPEAQAFKKVFGIDQLNGTTAAMFEDEARNLAYPFSIGMRTIHVDPEPQSHDYITHKTTHLSGYM
jgi:putative hydrolase of the HAD superfamily